jgi:hypothetical protein
MATEDPQIQSLSNDLANTEINNKIYWLYHESEKFAGPYRSWNNAYFAFKDLVVFPYVAGHQRHQIQVKYLNPEETLARFRYSIVYEIGSSITRMN